MSATASRNFDRYADTVVLVTGGTGFIGIALVERLLAMNADVHVLSRDGSKAVHGTTHWECTTANRSLVGRVIRSVAPSIVFHLAGRTDAGKSKANLLPTFKANAEGTLKLLEATAQHAAGSRFLNCASMEELWDDSMHGTSPYGVSKRVASVYVELFDALYDLSAFSLRPFFVYGPGRQPATKLVPHVMHSLLAGQAPSVASPGRGMDWIYLDDVVDAFLRAGLTHADPRGKVVDIGSGELRSIRDVVAIAARMLGDGRLEDTATDRDVELSPVADLRPANELLGWRPTTALDVGMKATVDWYRRQATD